MGYEWRPYVSVAERRRRAAREVAKLGKQGRVASPVAIEGRAIARTFWGKAWCDNLERYSDYENRLPRGRTYVRNGSVLDLAISPAEVNALVIGSALYRVAVKVAAVPAARWRAIRSDCAGAIDSLVELLQGRLSDAVMERICRAETGLFPSPAEIEFSCTCPDWASMCKHVAAALYGIGARLDRQPDLLFRLREVDENDLIGEADRALPLSRTDPAASRILADDGLSELFGLELAMPAATPPSAAASPTANQAPPKRAPRKPAAPERAAAKRPATASRAAARKKKAPAVPVRKRAAKNRS